MAQSKKRIVMGTTSSSSTFFAYYAATAKLVAASEAPIQLSIAESGGIEENLARMSKGEFDLAMTASQSLYEAYTGTSKNWIGKPQTQQRLLYLNGVAPQAFMVRVDSGVNSVSELAGKKWSPGHQGSGSEAVTMKILEVLGVKPNLTRGAMTDIVRGIKAGEMIGFSKGLPGFRLDATFLDIQANHPIRIIGFSDQEVATLKKDYPSLPHLKLPAKLANMPTEQNSWAFLVGTCAPVDLSEEAAYWLTKIAIEQRDELAKAFAMAGESDPVQLTLTEGNIPLHPGSIRYFKEKGHTIPARLMK